MKILKTLLLGGMLIATSPISAQKHKVACVGNSVTYGMGLPDRERQSYPVKLQEMLGQDYEVRNFGHSGTTLLTRGHNPYIKVKEFHEALKFAADRIVIHLGLNDTDPRNWPLYRDDFERNYYALIDSFRQANPKAKIWICLMTPIGDRHRRFLSGTRDWHGQIQQAILRVSEHAHVGLIDLHTPLYNRPELFPDALHPNPEGALILAQTVYQNITGNYGGLKMPVIYSDNMVIQRGRPIIVSGTANANEKIDIKFSDEKTHHTEKATTKAQEDGTWSVALPQHEAGGSYRLKVSTQKRKLCFRNVMIGEVWLCSGQSNMAFKVQQSATAREDIAQANSEASKYLRLFNMKPRWETYATEWGEGVLDSINRLQYFDCTGWTLPTADEVANFSAVAYHFGRMLADSLHVPIGLVCNAVGGSPAEAWISRRTLEYEYPAILKDWKSNDHIQSWVRERASLNTKKSTNPYQRHPYEPCYLQEAGIKPLEGVTLRGVIWYQGESNAHNIELHEHLFKLLVKDWRKELGKTSELPFYMVQLSSLNRPSWMWFRDSQRRLADSIQGCAIAVSSDLGDSLDVHPTHKKEVGERLALQALYRLYGFKHIVPSGPWPVRLIANKNKLEVKMDWAEGLHTSDGLSPTTFEIGGADGIFLPAEVSLGEGGVTVWNKQIEHPVSVRYGWQPFTRANIVNRTGLPLTTFRMDIKR